MCGQRAAPLLLLAAAVVCVLVALRVLPAITAPASLGPQPAVIVDDTGAPVVVSRCTSTCDATTGRATLAPGHQLRAGLPGGPAWVIEDAGGRRLGCLSATSAGQRLPVSRAAPCPTPAG